MSLEKTMGLIRFLILAILLGGVHGYIVIYNFIQRYAHPGSFLKSSMIQSTVFVECHLGKKLYAIQTQTVLCLGLTTV